MSGPGIVWFNGPDRFEQRLSLIEGALPGKALAVANKTALAAAARMREVVYAGGMNKTQKGGARIDWGDMMQTIKASAHMNGRNRAQAEFGFINPTDYTIFQERGTKYIAPMWAYAEAQELAAITFSNLIDTTKWFQTSKI